MARLNYIIPATPVYNPIVLTLEDDGALQVIAEYLEVLRGDG